MNDPLEKELYSLGIQLRQQGIVLTIGGGYGLLLRQRHVQWEGIRTLRQLPASRSTEDIDIIFTTELIVDSPRIRKIRDALQDCGYKAIERAKYFQFVRNVSYFGQERQVKIDLLAPLPGNEEDQRKLNIKGVRIRPKDVPYIHARIAPEAMTAVESPLSLKLYGDKGEIEVLIPHPFTYCVMKLHAFHDRKNDPGSDYGKHHVFDLYRTLAMCTEQEWQEITRIHNRYVDDPAVTSAKEIVNSYFNDMDATGMLSLREYARNNAIEIDPHDLSGFLEDIAEVFTS